MSIRLHGTMKRPTGPLFDLYERYVGEPRTRKDVYGYVAFIVGYALGLAGVTAYLAGSGSGAVYVYRWQAAHVYLPMVVRGCSE